MKKVKYRVYHFDPDRLSDYKYGIIDIEDKDKAIEHYKKSRTAQSIYQMIGRKRGEQINPRTGEALFSNAELFKDTKTLQIKGKCPINIKPKRTQKRVKKSKGVFVTQKGKGKLLSRKRLNRRSKRIR